MAGPEGQLDWTTFDMDQELLACVNHLTDTGDTILLGRKMTEGFIKYWENVVTQPQSPECGFAQKMVAIPKVVFSRTVKQVEGKNVRVENIARADAAPGPPPIRSWDRPRPWLPRALSHFGGGRGAANETQGSWLRARR